MQGLFVPFDGSGIIFWNSVPTEVITDHWYGISLAQEIGFSREVIKDLVTVNEFTVIYCIIVFCAVRYEFSCRVLFLYCFVSIFIMSFVYIKGPFGNGDCKIALVIDALLHVIYLLLFK